MANRGKRGGSGRVGWVVNQMILGRAYTAKDIQLMCTASTPFGPVTRKEAKSIVYGILRSKCYLTQTSDADRKGVILQRRDARAVSPGAAPVFMNVFNRACIKLLPAGSAAQSRLQ